MQTELKEKLLENMVKNLLVLRTKLRLKQIEVANMIGVTRQTYMAIETGKRPLPWSTFLALVLIFSKNKETNMMMTMFDIYTDELNEYIKSGKLEIDTEDTDNG